MVRTRLVKRKDISGAWLTVNVPYTAEEEAQRDAEESAWALAQIGRAAREEREARERAEDELLSLLARRDLAATEGIDVTRIDARIAELRATMR